MSIKKDETPQENPKMEELKQKADTPDTLKAENVLKEQGPTEKAESGATLSPGTGTAPADNGRVVEHKPGQLPITNPDNETFPGIMPQIEWAMKAAQKPSVGRIVHYTPEETEQFGKGPIAAIITKVWQDLSTEEKGADLDADTDYLTKLGYCGLGLHTTSGYATLVKKPFSAEPKPGHWSWPPRN